MSEDPTQNLPDGRSLEERIFARFDAMDARLDKMDAHLNKIDERLTTLEDRVDRRLKETRPIWERALAEIAEMHNEMREGFEKIRSEMNNGLRRVDRQIDVLNRNILEVRADLRYMDERITKLESEPAQ